MLPDGLLIDHVGTLMTAYTGFNILDLMTSWIYMLDLMTAYTDSLSVQKQEGMRYTRRDRQMIKLACFVSWRLRLAAILSTS